MVKRKNNKIDSNLIGLGILDGLKEDAKENLNEDADKNSKIESSIKAVKKEGRSKRSFMLNESSIRKLQFIKLIKNDLDLSTIVEEAISLYFEGHKDEIDNIIRGYEEL